MKRLIKSLMILFMWYPMRLVVGFLPLRATWWLAVAGGQMLYAISRSKRRVMWLEFSRAMPSMTEAEISKTVKGSFVNYCASEAEVLLYPSLNSEFIRRFVRIEGMENLDRALGKGKGVLLYQAHFGAFQMTMPAVGYSGYKMNQISASASVWKEESGSSAQRRMFDIKAKYEYALPVRHISVTSSLKPLFKALKENEIVGITVDGGGGKKVVPINFLGREALFQTGAADIAVSTGAEIVPVFIITEKGLRHRLFIHEPIKFDPEPGKEENRKVILQAFASLLEGYVKKYPDHYGYTLCLRRTRASSDTYPFFSDYGGGDGGPVETEISRTKVSDHA